MATGIGQSGFGSKTHRYADAGKYFVASNPTPGTGVIGMVSTTNDATKPSLLFKNGNSVASGVRCYLDYLRLYCTVVGVGHTAPKASLYLDVSQSTTRYTSGGSSITPVNVNGDSTNASAVTFYFGAITAAAAGSARLINSHALTSGAIEVVYDSFVFDFGAPSHSIPTSLADNTTTITHKYFSEPPVIVGPQQHFSMIIWAASNSTGITWAFDMGWIEV